MRLGYLIRECLWGGVTDLAAIGYARDLCSHLQHMGQGQISYVRVHGAVKTHTQVTLELNCTDSV